MVLVMSKWRVEEHDHPLQNFLQLLLIIDNIMQDSKCGTWCTETSPSVWLVSVGASK